MGFGTAWLERQVFVCTDVDACGSACLTLWAMCSQCRPPCHWRMCARCVCGLRLCIFCQHAALRGSILQRAVLRPAWPVKCYLSHQSLWELWPLNHCQQSDSVIYYAPRHTQTCTQTYTVLKDNDMQLDKFEGQAWCLTHVVNTLVCKHIPIVCLQRRILTHKDIHTLSETPWLVAVNPWYVLGNMVHRLLARENTERLAGKKKRHRQTDMHTYSRTYWDRYGGCCFIEAPCCFYLCPRGNLPNASCHRFQNSSTVLSCSNIYNSRLGESCLSNLFSHAKGQVNFVFSNYCLSFDQMLQSLPFFDQVIQRLGKVERRVLCFPLRRVFLLICSEERMCHV